MPAFTGSWPSRRTGRCAGRRSEPVPAAAAGPRRGTWPPWLRWYLAHDPCAAAPPIPDLMAIVVPARPRGARSGPGWSSLPPAVWTLNPQARAELAWTATVLAGAIGDDAAALAARQRLAPLLAGIADPFLHAVSQLALAWTLPITGDLDGTLREVTVSLEELRGQDEPVFTAMAAFTAGLFTRTWRWAATTTLCTTCARRATWPSGPVVTGRRGLPDAAGHPGCTAGPARRGPGAAG